MMKNILKVIGKRGGLGLLFLAGIMILWASASVSLFGEEWGKRVVGVSSFYRGEMTNVSSVVCEAIQDAGGVPVILPITKSNENVGAMLDRVDALVVVGGPDIDPARYGEEPIPELGTIDRKRDEFDETLIKEAIKRELPILAIQRGLQMVNVLFGGTLYQDISTCYPPFTDADGKPIRIFHSDSDHPISIEKNSRLYQIIGEETVTVRSVHHQAVKKVANGFQAVAFAPDGLVEAIESDTYPKIIAVQWNPERLNDSTRLKLFKAILSE